VRAVRYHPRVPTETRGILSFYSAISKQLGDQFWNELTEAIRYAREFPERHHFDTTGRRRANLNKFPIHFLFRIFPGYIRVTVVGTTSVIRPSEPDGPKY